jgi:hypothetical protein
MKLRHSANGLENEHSIIARFGQAALIKKPEGSHLLVGGSADDRGEAREWISLFMHEVVVGDK